MSLESEIWPSVLELIGERLKSKMTFSLWFGDLSLQKLIDDKVYLQTTNDFKKKNIELHLMQRVC